MAEKRKLSATQKEKKLIEQIEQAKKKLADLQQKKKLEIGTLACKHKLDTFELSTLDKSFKQLAKDLSE